MNLFLLERGEPPRPWFYSEDPAVVVAEVSSGRRRARSPTERLARRLKAAWWRARRRAGPGVRRVLDGLNRRDEPDGPLLRGLWRANAVRLYHPSRLTSEQARRAWRHYLARRGRRELIASAWDLVLAALSLPLMVLPGPNVVGFWFLWRSISHWMALLGTWRSRRRSFPTELVALDVLNGTLADEARVGRVAAECELRHLPASLRRLERGRKAAGVAADPPMEE
jgi:hypothetical protein